MTVKAGGGVGTTGAAVDELEKKGGDGAEGGDGDGVAAKEGEEDPNAESGAEDGADPDEGGGGEAGSDGGGEAGAEGAESPEEGAEGGSEEDLDKKVAAAVEAHNKKLAEEQAKKAPAVQPLSEQEYQAMEEQSGLNRQSIDWVVGLVREAMGRVRSYTDGKVGGFDKENAINRMAGQKEFADIRKYKGEIDSYLQEKVPANKHNDPSVIADAYWIAKGKASGGLVKKASAGLGATKKVVDRARLNPPGGRDGVPAKKSGGGGKGFELTPQERSAYEAYGKNEFKSEREYWAALPRNRGKVAK